MMTKYSRSEHAQPKEAPVHVPEPDGNREGFHWGEGMTGRVLQACGDVGMLLVVWHQFKATIEWTVHIQDGQYFLRASIPSFVGLQNTFSNRVS
jgi:hypothetical protein